MEQGHDLKLHLRDLRQTIYRGRTTLGAHQHINDRLSVLINTLTHGLKEAWKESLRPPI